MDPLSIGLIGAGVGALGSVVGGWLGGKSQEKATASANETNVDLARQTREWSERLSNTAHVREVADLRAAGLNPILSAKHGGASTPTAQNPSVQPLDKRYVGDVVTKGLGAAYQVATMKQDLEQRDAQIQAQKAAAIASIAQGNLAQASAQSTVANMPSIKARASTAFDEAEAHRSRYKFEKRDFEMRSKFQTYDHVSSRVLEAVGGVTGAAGLMKLFQGLGNSRRNQTMREEEHLRRQGPHGTRLD